MRNFQPLGIVGVNEKGDFVYLPIQVAQSLTVSHENQIAVNIPLEGVGGVVAAPSPEEDRINKEQKKPQNLHDVLAKYKPEDEK